MTRKILSGLVLFGFILFSILLVTQRILYRRVELPSNKYSEHSYNTAYTTLLTQNRHLPEISNKEYRKKIGIRGRIYIETGLSQSYALPQLNIILMQNNLTNEEYCIMLAHEELHLRKYSANETYISFETFKFLYTSPDIYLHQAGVLFGLKQLDDQYYNEYDIKGQIINYLTDIKIQIIKGV